MQSIAVYPAVPILAASFAAIPSGRGRAQSALQAEISTRKIWKHKGNKKDQLISEAECSPDACLASVATPVVGANTPSIHHHRVTHSEKRWRAEEEESYL